MNWTPQPGDQVPQILRGYPRLEHAMIAADVEPMTVDRLLNVELPDLTAEAGFPGGHLVGGTVAFRWRWNGTEFEAA